MFKILTIVAFLSAQVMPLQTFAGDPIATEFEKSAQAMQNKVAKEKAAVEKRAKLAELRGQRRESAIQLAARVEELETLAEQIPNVREDVIEDSARSLQAAEREDDREDLFGISAVVAVASGVVYALTQFDAPKAWAHIKTTKVGAKADATPKVKTTVVSKSLRKVYGNKPLAKGAAVTGVLAALVAGVAYLDSNTMSVQEMSAIETLENTYLSQLVTGNEGARLTEDEIEYALTKKYKDDPAFREAVLNEVRTIVSESERLNSEISAKTAEIESTARL
jgi:hypothetical protein